MEWLDGAAINAFVNRQRTIVHEVDLVRGTRFPYLTPWLTEPRLVSELISKKRSRGKFSGGKAAGIGFFGLIPASGIPRRRRSKNAGLTLFNFQPTFAILFPDRHGIVTSPIYCGSRQAWFSFE